MKRLILMILAFGPFSGFGQNAKSTDASIFLKYSDKPIVSQERRFNLDKTVLTQILSGSSPITFTNFPVSTEQSAEVVLKPCRPVTDAATLITKQVNGAVVSIPQPKVYTWKGIIPGKENSLIYITYYEDNFLAFIQDGKGNDYVVAPDPTTPSNIVMAKSTSILPNGLPSFDCITDNLPENAAYLAYPPKMKTNATKTLLQVNIAAEADSSYYSRAGGTDQKAVSYIMALFSMVSMYYENEIGTTLRLSWIKVWAKNDPYQVKGNAYALQPVAQKYWNTNNTTVSRDIAHIMTSTSYGSGGYGLLNTICDKTNAYSFSGPTCAFTYPYFAFNYDAYIIAHEIGHNFGASHTYTCFYGIPLDTCNTKDDKDFPLGDACLKSPFVAKSNAGSIMSYCGNTNYKKIGKYVLRMTFLQPVIDVMRSNIEGKTCITSPAGPTVVLTSPRGDKNYNGSVNIDWLYAGVNNVNLDYSTDNGAKWIKIDSNIAASLGAYTWKNAAFSQPKVLVRISATTDKNVADTSLAQFSVSLNAGIDNLDFSDGITMLPNPAKDKITINSPGFLINRIVIYDLIGHKISDISPLETSFSLDCLTMKNGVYIIELFSSHGMARKKMIIEK